MSVVVVLIVLTSTIFKRVQVPNRRPLILAHGWDATINIVHDQSATRNDFEQNSIGNE